MTPSFFYFDLGRVLIDFNVEKMLHQIAVVANIDPDRVREVIFDSGLQIKYESGQIDCREFYDCFSEATATRCDFESLRCAVADIFAINVSVIPIVAQLRAAGYRLGILSNTCLSHWEHCSRRYRSIIELFDIYALSYQLKAVKPQAVIFEAAANLAGTEPAEIFFVDDIPGHVEAAKSIGFDAVVYTSARQLAADLHNRGARFNY